MVAGLMAIVSFFAVRVVNSVDEIDASVHTVKEVQASQREIINGLQRDRDYSAAKIEKLQDEVDRLKEENALLKMRRGIRTSLVSEPPSGGFFCLNGSN
jgi:hypothetical protein